jgi:hypothetical protein
MWTAISYVSSALTLIAFVWAVSAWLYRFRLLRTERLIRTVPETERAALVERTLVLFSIDSTKLTRDQQYKLALRQIHEQAANYRVTAIVVVIIACLAAAVTLIALFRTQSTNTDNLPQISPTSTPVPSSTPAAIQTPAQTSSLTSSNAGKIEGCRVHDGIDPDPVASSGKWLKGIKIEARNAQGDVLETVSDSEGLFEFIVPASDAGSEYKLTIYNGGWPREQTVTVHPNKFTEVPRLFCVRREVPTLTPPPLTIPSPMSLPPNLDKTPIPKASPHDSCRCPPPLEGGIDCGGWDDMAVCEVLDGKCITRCVKPR